MVVLFICGLCICRYACDIRVIRLIRERTLGNSCIRLAKHLKENHIEEWLQRLSRYFGKCADFVDRPSLFPVVCQEPPEPVAVPTNKWLMTVYAKDIMSRMNHIKARITTVFGSVLKMDSTKKAINYIIHKNKLPQQLYLRCELTTFLFCMCNHRSPGSCQGQQRGQHCG